ncbi:MAG: cyclophilin-like fold protein [Thaumarchaeota archaeon]|nr:cyclophilin-like fold protein [Nitrososphaerota archaeon]
MSSDDHEGVKKELSVSKVECKVRVRGKGEFVIELYKHLAPITVNALMRALPMSSRVTIYPRAMVCVLTGIKTGVEKQRFEYSKGEIAFLAANGSLCFFTANVKSASPLNPIGKLQSDLGVLERLTAGDVLEISQALEIGAQT